MVDPLRERKVDQKIVTVLVTDIIKFDIPVAESNSVQFLKSGKHLKTHIGNFQLKRG